MIKGLKSIAAICFAAIIFTACKKDVKDTVLPEVSEQTLAQIKSLGFGTKDVKKIDEGYLVEGDIILTEKDLSSTPTSPYLVVAQEEQYRTFNLVSPTEHPTIRVALSNSSSAHQSVFSAALDEAIRRYNAQSLRIKFQRVTSSPRITVVAYYEVSNMDVLV